ncbi:MAG: sulfotransferase [Pirellulaceae bacterium]|nr:sulfotransferase [Pirellulaceae bacterium]
MATHPLENIPWLLATGQGRSGTTVLTKALAEHPAVWSNRVESNVIKDVLMAGFASSTMPSRVRQMVVSREQHDLIFRQMLLDLLFPTSGKTPSATPQALSTFSAMNPQAAEFATSVFPKIHFVNIIRHGVEVVASRMVHRSLGKHSFEEHCVAWKTAQEMAEWGVGRDDFTLFRHEDLLEEVSCQMAFKNLFQSAGLETAAASADYVLNNQFNKTVYDQENSTGTTDLRSRQQRWQLWTPSQQEIFKKVCGPGMEYFGYLIPA